MKISRSGFAAANSGHVRAGDRARRAAIASSQVRVIDSLYFAVAPCAVA